MQVEVVWDPVVHTWRFATARATTGAEASSGMDGTRTKVGVWKDGAGDVIPDPQTETK